MADEKWIQIDGDYYRFSEVNEMSHSISGMSNEMSWKLRFGKDDWKEIDDALADAILAFIKPDVLGMEPAPKSDEPKPTARELRDQTQRKSK